MHFRELSPVRQEHLHGLKFYQIRVVNDSPRKTGGNASHSPYSFECLLIYGNGFGRATKEHGLSFTAEPFAKNAVIHDIAVIGAVYKVFIQQNLQRRTHR